MQAMLDRIGGRILGSFLLSTLLATIGLTLFAPYSPAFPPPTPSTLRSSVSDGSTSEYARVTGVGGLEKVSGGENDLANLGFGVARPDVILKFSSNSWGSGGERIE